MEDKKVIPQQASHKKLKVVWLCYFSNEFVQDQLRPIKRIGEIAPWINSLIKLFENNNEIELHIVSQHEWISGYKRFISKGITFHFFNKGMPVIGRHWPSIFPFDFWNDYFFIKKHIRHIVKRVNPDIIHLHGAENEFSSSILQFHNIYPVFITVQGFINKSSVKSKRAQRRTIREFEIYKTYKHYGIRTETMGKDIKYLSPHAVLHWHSYPNNEIKTQIAEKKYDLVFFARVTKEKGIEDLLEAVSIIKKDKADISLCVIGEGKTDGLKKLAADLNISENIYWAGFLPTQDDVHKLASQARISVLPTYHDIISGTILESLFLKLPVVAYDVGSIHEVNNHEEIISLVDKQNVVGLAKKIIALLRDTKLQNERADKGYRRTVEMFTTSYNQIRDDLLNAYSKVIKDFKN